MQRSTPNPVMARMTMLIIWGALLGSQFILLAVLYVLKPNLFNVDLNRPVIGPNWVMYAAFAFIAVWNFAVSFLARRNYFKRAVDEQNVSFVQNGMIVSCALCESVALIGFLLGFVYGYQYFFAFFALGIVGILLHFPKLRDIEAASFKSLPLN